jgi:hypothetical protein
MAISGACDLGLGDTCLAAYTRIVDFIHRPEVPEVEISIENYYNRNARKLYIIKNYMMEYVKNNPVSDANMKWLQNNIFCRYVAPLQTMKFASKDFSHFPGLNIVNGGEQTINEWATTSTGEKVKIASKTINIPPSFTTNTGDSVTLSYFYNWLKTRTIHGLMTNIQNDASNASEVINDFKAQHPEIFNGE